MKNFNNFIKEYKDFIKNYIYNLIGNPYSNDFVTEEIDESNSNNFRVTSGSQCIFFHIPNCEFYIRAKLNKDITDENLGLVNKVCENFKEVSIYSYKDGTQKSKKVSEYEQNKRYNYAIQLGICYWLSERGEKIEELLAILEDWSVKTYEGRKVSYSIIIDTSKDNIQPISNKFFEFLKDEFSATLTDSITSAFLIDIEGNLKKYVSIVDENKHDNVQEYRLINNLPLRFANLISKEVYGNRVGIFLLSNGDILVSKKGEIILVKRNDKWLNCQLSSFENALTNFKKEFMISDTLIKELFSTVLDISFSHTGGLIALLTNEKYLIGEEQIISNYDQLSVELSYKKLKEEIKQNNESLTDNELKKEAFKRQNKKEIIKILLSKEDSRNFIDIERKMRSELAALDGAFIINKEGEILTVGTIVQNDKGSSGGGRSAAAKKLSKQGIAIKISTDGYIEVFEKGKKIYSIK